MNRNPTHERDSHASRQAKLNVVMISDTHGYHDRLRDRQIPKGDVLIHCGDCTIDGSYFGLREFLMWFNALPHRHKILVAGNHDWIFEKQSQLAELALKEICPSVHYLQDSGCDIDGLKFWGSPVQPEFMAWAFNRNRGEEIEKHWNLIPQDTDVLVTHGPPMGILDTACLRGEHLGCDDLRRAVERVRPRLHCFGHIHGGYGEFHNGITFFNAAICDEAYNPIREAQTLRLSPK